jgi:hypothetical protein
MHAIPTILSIDSAGEAKEVKLHAIQISQSNGEDQTKYKLRLLGFCLQDGAQGSGRPAGVPLKPPARGQPARRELQERSGNGAPDPITALSLRTPLTGHAPPWSPLTCPSSTPKCSRTFPWIFPGPSDMSVRGNPISEATPTVS